MIGSLAEAKCYLDWQSVNMHKGIDGLARKIEHVLKMAPYCGQLFLFRASVATISPAKIFED